MIRTVIAYAFCFFFVAVAIQILIHLLANSASIVLAAWGGYRLGLVVRAVRIAALSWWIVRPWRGWRWTRRQPVARTPMQLAYAV